jgi:hypothetical protein
VQLSTHRIRRQRWLCRTRSQEEAFSLRGHLREALEEAVPAAFERAFDEAVPGGEEVRIPRLELTVRLSRAEDLQALLPDLLRRAASEQLQSLLRPGERSTPAAARMRRSSHESRLEALVRYLRTGALPWELAQAEATALREQLRETAREELAAVLSHAPDPRTSFPQSIAFFFRLLQLLPVEKWEGVATHLPVSTLQALRQAVAALFGNSPEGSIPETASPGRAAEGSPGRESREHESEESSAQPRRGGRSETGTAVPPLPGLAMEEVAIRRPGAHAAGLPSIAPDGALKDGVQRPSASWGETAVEARAFPVDGEVEETNVFPVLVRCAGLVLLHPFLPRLFENRDVDLRRQADLPRAAALLHWLATGRDEVLEFELGFVKALLGQRPEAALLVREGLLTEADREEGEALLRAAIGHWKALKNTTPAGLRGSFLQRGGLLREEEKGWRLQVEPAAFDVLLDHLPWGIGVVKLPWMTQPIFTEWPAP